MALMVAQGSTDGEHRVALMVAQGGTGGEHGVGCIWDSSSPPLEYIPNSMTARMSHVTQ